MTEPASHSALPTTLGEGSLVLPAECLKALMMTLPEMMRRALRRQHRDASLRLVDTSGSWEIETSTEPGTLIMTLRTPDGFDVSFALEAKQLRDMAEAVGDKDVAAAAASRREMMH